jgi:Ca2+-binding EF-hand superfamily protein
MGALRKDINQLRHLLDTLGFDWSFEEVKCAFNKMDSNYNDEVDFREFYKW